MSEEHEQPSSGEAEVSTRSCEARVSVSEAIFLATETLRAAGVPEARREAGSLLLHILNRDRTYLITHPAEAIDPLSLALFKASVERRAGGEPLQYIAGEQDFFGLKFVVTGDVLIPRPETELLVEAALRLSTSGEQPLLICDVGTGSGCIAVTMLHERLNSRAIALDISPAALEVARVNAIRHLVSERISLVASDCFSAIKKEMIFDVILSNPPYVSADALPGLQREVRDFEPKVALTPGGDGLSIIRTLVTESPAYLKSGGHLLLEIGFDQGAAVQEFISPRVWRLLDIQEDLQGIPRIVALEKL